VTVTGELPPQLVAVEVDPPTLTVPLAVGGALTATAVYDDDSTVDVTDMATWTSSDAGVATVADGAISPVTAGDVTITAAFGGFDDTAAVTVSPAELLSIAIDPPMLSVAAGTSVTLTATGSYDDGSTADLTDAATWTSTDDAIATAPGGALEALTPGNATITASFEGVDGSMDILVTDATLETLELSPPSPSAPVGRTVDVSATGLYSDDSTQDLTSLATWTAVDTGIATVDSAGVVTCVSEGTTTITAEFEAESASVDVVCTAAVLETLTIAPASASLAAGRTIDLAVTGLYSDGAELDLTDVVVWSSADEAVATASNAANTQGRVTAVAPGAVDITASLGDVTDIAELSVTDAELVSIEVAPATQSLAQGLSLEYVATGTFSDSSSQDLTTQVTWSTSNAGTAAISNVDGTRGVATALAVGTVTVTATLGAISDDAELTVTDAELVSIAISASPTSITMGSTAQLTAMGTYTDATETDITTAVTWGSADAGVIVVSNALGSEGEATGVAVGTTDVSAALGGVTATLSIEVTPTPPVLIAMRPADGVTGVRATTSVSFRFNEAMDVATMTAQTADGACSGSLQLSADDFATCIGFAAAAPIASSGDTVFTLTPAAPLTRLARYRLRATTAAENVAGVGLVADETQPTGFRVMTDGPCADGLVISQVFGAGGNAGAPFNADFVELHNPTGSSISLAGTAIQYASAGGSVWSAKALPSVAIPAGGYYLIQTVPNGAVGADFAEDLLLSPQISMSGTAGKVALTPFTTTLSGLCPSTDVIDIVGFGAAATCADGTPTANLSATLAAVRAGGGCADSGDDNTDLPTAAPAPRNLTAAARICECAANESDSLAELGYCNLQFPITLSVDAGAPTDLIFGRVYEAGVTEPAGASSRISAQLGYGASGSDPTTSTWSWAPMAYNVQFGNDDEYMGTLTVPAAGTFAYTTRASLDGVNWTYCDSDGAGDAPLVDFSAALLGTLTVN
jgi:hypothetical protein